MCLNDSVLFTEGSLPALRTRDEGSCSQPSQIIIQLRKQVIFLLPTVKIIFLNSGVLCFKDNEVIGSLVPNFCHFKVFI